MTFLTHDKKVFVGEYFCAFGYIFYHKRNKACVLCIRNHFGDNLAVTLIRTSYHSFLCHPVLTCFLALVPVGVLTST